MARVLGVLIAAALLAACGGGDSPKGSVPPKRGVPLAATPFMGVSCDRRPNWFGCDRVGLYVWLERKVRRLDAFIEGRRVPMRRTADDRAAQSWEGFLRPAGLISGRLKLRPERGRYYWYGKRPRSGRVRLTVVDRDGRSSSRTVRVRLMAGYG